MSFHPEFHSSSFFQPSPLPSIIDIHPSYDVCLTPGSTSVMIEFDEVPSPELYMILLRLEHHLRGLEGESETNESRESKEEKESLPRRKNYYFFFSGVFDIDLVVTKFVEFFNSRGMKVRLRRDFEPIAEMEVEFLTPDSRIMYLTQPE